MQRKPNLPALALILAAVLGGTLLAQAQPMLLSTSPPDGAGGVSTTTTIVFTFSEAMDTNLTEATFFDVSPFGFFPTTPSWNASQTVLTCTPNSPFPPNKAIYWTLDGENTVGDPLAGPNFGSFTTAGPGGGGSGTNATTTFSVGKVHHYNQTSAGASTLDPATPYGFAGVTSLASNRTANTVTLTMPNSAVSNLVHLPPPQAEIFLLSTTSANLSSYDATFQAGDYTFFVQGDSSNQTVVVNLPIAANMPQPGAPHLTNYLAAQMVNPNQTFVLAWDAFPGGTAADYIDVDVGTNGSPNPGLPGALNGTATTFTIPAGTLLPNTTYSSRIGFFRFAGATNANYTAAAFRSTYIEFSLITTGGGSVSPIILTNPAYASGSFSFDVLCATGQVVTVEYRTNLTTGVWRTLLTTNSPGSRFRAISPQAATNSALFYRGRNGS